MNNKEDQKIKEEIENQKKILLAFMLSKVLESKIDKRKDQEVERSESRRIRK